MSREGRRGLGQHRTDSSRTTARSSSVANQPCRHMSTVTEPGASYGKLRFHRVHGKEVSLSVDSRMAIRNEDVFENSIVFSNRPAHVNEVIAIKVTNTTREFCGPLRIGFTTINPEAYQSTNNVPLGRDLQDESGVWLKGVHLLPYPYEDGVTIYYMVNHDGIVLHGVNGQNLGILFRDVNVSVPFWVILEAYGSVQGFEFIDSDASMAFPHNPQVVSNVPLPPLPSIDRSDVVNNAMQESRSTVVTRKTCWDNMISFLFTRKTTQGPLPSQGLNSKPVGEWESHSRKPQTNFGGSDAFQEEPCIICSEREKNTALVECGHLCMCYECAKNYIDHHKPTTTRRMSEEPIGRHRRPRILAYCPICRASIYSLLRVYYS